jgi:hypothetical protein
MESLDQLAKIGEGSSYFYLETLAQDDREVKMLVYKLQENENFDF